MRLVSALLVAATVLVVAALSGAFLCAVPEVAYAEGPGYSIDELSTELTVQTDGSVHVIEHQVLTFEGKNKGCVWYLHTPESGESVRINMVRAAPVDDGGTLTDEWIRMQMTDVDVSEQGASPGDMAAGSLRTSKTQPWYSYSISDGMIRNWFPAEEGGTYLIEADYTVLNRLVVYRDVAEVYWRYAHGSLPVSANDVTLRVVLPVPAGAEAQSGQEVLAWGHGPNAGAFAVGEDGAVVYHIDQLEQGQYAEAHVIFPANWETDLAAHAPHVYSELHRQTAIAEEDEWVDSFARGANWDYQVRILFLAITAIVILVGAICVAWFGRSYRSRRVLIRTACTLGVAALAANLFFAEPLTVGFMAAAAAVVLIASFFLPGPEEQVVQEELSAPEGLSAQEEANVPEEPDVPDADPGRSDEGVTPDADFQHTGGGEELDHE